MPPLDIHHDHLASSPRQVKDMPFFCFKAVFIVSVLVDCRKISSKALPVEKTSLSVHQKHAFESNPTNERIQPCYCRMSKPSSDTHSHGRPHKRKAASSTSSSETQKRSTMTNVAPLYITIGPQCCGKSTFLKKLEGGKIKDVSLDDQPDVYVSVPTNVFLGCITDKYPTDADSLKLMQQVYQGKSIQERIRNDNDELGLILQRWSGDISPEEFHMAIQALYTSRELPLEVAEQLVVVVETYMKRKKADSKPRSLPKAVDVFILESLFLPHPNTQQSAIQRAQEELRMTPKHIPIAWGNTNSKSRDYSEALEIAFQFRRPVRFVLCLPFIDGGEVAAIESPLITLPWISLSDLLRRNLKRLKKTGRYIPAFSIADCCKRVESLVTIHQTEGFHTVEQQLVSLASPPFVNRYDGKQQRRRTSAFKYTLSTQHLIRKKFLNDATSDESK
jgi:hypothetical protein